MPAKQKKPTLSQRLLGAIERLRPLALRTPDLIAVHASGLRNARQRVWGELQMLERNGLVVKVPAAIDDRRKASRWRAA